MEEIVKFNSSKNLDRVRQLAEFLDGNILRGNLELVYKFINSKEWRFYDDSLKETILLYCGGILSEIQRSEIFNTMRVNNEELLKKFENSILEEFYETYGDYVSEKLGEKLHFNRLKTAVFRKSGFFDVNYYNNGKQFCFSYRFKEIKITVFNSFGIYRSKKILLSLNMMKSMASYMLLNGYFIEEVYNFFPELKIIDDTYKLIIH